MWSAPPIKQPTQLRIMMAPTLRSNFIYIERGRARYISNFIYIELVSNFYLWPCKLSKSDTVKRKTSDETTRPGAARGILLGFQTGLGDVPELPPQHCNRPPP